MDRLFEAFERAGHQLYLVGGAVRDLLVGIPLSRQPDLDFATDARPDETVEILRRSGFTTYDVGRRFGTIGTVLRGPAAEGYPKDCQVTTFRARERYEAGSRHPEVEYGETIEDDLWRRDFSVNSMARRRDGTLVDPYRGAADIEAGVLRSVGDPLEVLREDPLRILRIARFISQLGFTPDAPLRHAATERAESLLGISRERWLQEMGKLLVGEHAAAALTFMLETRSLGIVLPEVAAMAGFHESCPVHHKDLFAHTLGVLTRAERDPVQRWAALCHDTGKVWTRRVDEAGQVSFIGHEAHSAMLFEAIAARFRLDHQSARAVRFVIRHHDLATAYTPEWTDAAVRRFVRRADEHVDALLAFARSDLTTADRERRESALNRVDELEARIGRLEKENRLRVRFPKGLGNHLIDAYGLEPGPAVGELMTRLQEAAMEGQLPTEPTVEECLSLLKKGGM